MKRPAVFIDRDGTLLEDADYVADPDRVVLVPGAVEALRVMRAAGFGLVTVTNQSGIARGLYSESDYHAVAARLDALLHAQGASVDETRYCPHHPDFGSPCGCRKPATGMYLDAAAALGLDLKTSYFVGDKVTDVLPALELEGQGILVRTGFGSQHQDRVSDDVWIVDDLRAAAERIRRRSARPSRR